MSDYEFSPNSWEKLKLLRDIFLNPKKSAAGDYWSSKELLEIYDHSFARRIFWKWEHALETISEIPEIDCLWDWGCGSGAATEAILNRFPEFSADLFFSDRSPLAQEYCREKISSQYSVEIAKTEPLNRKYGIIISHVLNEVESMPPALMAAIDRAEFVFCLESGTPSASQNCINLRERIRKRFQIMAPCPHQNRCPLFNDKTPKNPNQHWCHFFSFPPNTVHQSAFWSKFSQELGIDLRRISYSYFFAKKYCSEDDLERSEDGQFHRIIGLPRIYKAHAKILDCSSDGLLECTLNKRQDSELFKSLKKSKFDSWQNWKIEKGKIK